MREDYALLMEAPKGYGQFCPVARAAEILAERWTPLLIRELLCGSVRFNELHRGVPRMSSSLLARRLKEMEHAGIVERHQSASGVEYHLTESGRELFPIVEGMGNWAQRWVRDDLLADENLDPDLLMWDVRRRVISANVTPNRRFVVRFAFRGMPSHHRRYWLLFDRGEVDLCVKDPGYDVDLYVDAELRSLVRVWLGHETIDRAAASRQLELHGDSADVRGFRDWFGLSLFAPAGRAPSGTAANRSLSRPRFPPGPAGGSRRDSP